MRICLDCEFTQCERATRRNESNARHTLSLVRDPIMTSPNGEARERERGIKQVDDRQRETLSGNNGDARQATDVDRTSHLFCLAPVQCE